jgi:hypothetical protein
MGWRRREEKEEEETCCVRDLELQQAIFIKCSSISKTMFSQRMWWLFCEIEFQAFVPSSINLFAMLIWCLRKECCYKRENRQGIAVGSSNHLLYQIISPWYGEVCPNTS